MRCVLPSMAILLISFSALVVALNSPAALAGEPELAKADMLAHPEAVIIDYGNWCGYNNSREDPNYPVKDEVDAVCRTHDLCIRVYGYHDCRCDAAFLASMGAAKASTWEGESYRIAAILVFEVKPCACHSLQADGVGGKCGL